MHKRNHTGLNFIITWLEWIFITPFRRLGRWILGQLEKSSSNPSAAQASKAHVSEKGGFPLFSQNINLVSAYPPSPDPLVKAPIKNTSQPEPITPVSHQEESQNVLVQKIRKVKSNNAPQKEVTELVNQVIAMRQAKAQTTKLICIDFDGTLTQQHMHNLLAKDQIPTPYQGKGVHVFNKGATHKEDFSNIAPLNDQDMAKYKFHCMTKAEKCELNEPGKMSAFIKEGLKNGHRMAITSYTNYPDTIPTVLSRLQLTPEESKQIIIITGLPKTENQAKGKLEHIKSALKCTSQGVLDSHFNIPLNNVLLIDDSYYHINQALNQGFKALLAPLDDKGFDEAFKFIQVPALNVNDNSSSSPIYVLRKRGG